MTNSKMGWMDCSDYNPWYWMNYWWNRFLCVLGFHLWIVITDNCGSENFHNGDSFCMICFDTDDSA